MTNSSARRAKTFLRGAALVLAAIPALPGQGTERTPFKDMPSKDARREVIRSVLDSPLHPMRGGMPAREWTGAGYGGAWERARTYFPGQAYFVRPGTFFMTHGFGPDGRLFMEVHESAFLALSVENLRTFTDASIVGEYGRMAAADGGREAAAFREKTGRLERYFRGEAAKESLRKALGENLYLRLLRELREEDHHMFAGGLMHEGMHAVTADAALAARVQADFSAGRVPVQWDELRAHMAEVGCHRLFCRWAAGEVAAEWGRIGSLLEELEALRKRPKLVREADRARFERAEAGIGARIAFVRLRMRESWQSALRIVGLAASVRRDYAGPETPAAVEASLAGIAGGAGAFAEGLEAAIRGTELALRGLEEVLELWSEWASGGRPFPPPVTDTNEVLRRAKDTTWPAPPGEEAEALMKMAAGEIAGLRRMPPF
jgi:hypothetical protein